MIGRLLHILGFCQHSRTTFPQTPRGQAHADAHVTCLDCGREYAYDWGKMRVAQLSNSVLLFHPCLKKSVSQKP